MKTEIIHGDCREVVAKMAADSIDAIVTDPPYGLGFMAKDWDHGVPGKAFWDAMIRVAKPGAHLLAFGGTRTYHRLACAIEDAGWEIRDCVIYLYGTGFPKSRNLNGKYQGWGTALKPAVEPVILARKPLVGTVAENVQRYGTGALNIDGCRVASNGEHFCATVKGRTGGMTLADTRKGRSLGMFAPGKSFEPSNNPLGRWPANVIHDGSEEVMNGFPQSKDGVTGKRSGVAGVFKDGLAGYDKAWGGYGGSGSAARFFYCAKASRSERGAGNDHPTVKPLALMRYLCRLVTSPDGVILDPFAGSGSTGLGALAEGFNFIGIEQEAAYVEIARRRLDLALAGTTTSSPESAGTTQEGTP